MNVEHFAFAAGLQTRTRALKDCEVLFRAGQRPARMFFIEAGAVRLLRVSSDGSTAPMHRAGAGEWIAEASLYHDRYHCDAVSQGAALVKSVSKAALLEAFEAEPQRCLAFSKLLATRLRDLRVMHEIVRIKRADERVLQWLRSHAQGDPPRVRLQQSLSDVAQELSLTRESLYRTLAALRKAGAVDMNGAAITLRVRAAAVADQP